MTDGGESSFKWGLTPGADPKADPENSAPPAADFPTIAFPPLELSAPVAPLPVVSAPVVPTPVVSPPVVLPPEDPTQWLSMPLDRLVDDPNEVLEAEIIEPVVTRGSNVEGSAIDSLFGDTNFQDFSDEPMIAPLPPRAPAGADSEKPPRGPIPRVQKTLMRVAGGLLAVLMLVALFMLGTRLSAVLAPQPEASPTRTPAPTLAILPPGPVDPGKHQWDELLGGECLDPFESAWQDTYVVVDCAEPHPAQMVVRGTFDDRKSALYPGLDELQSRINLLCTAPTVIDYAAAGSAQDIQVAASFAADADEWKKGNRSYFCFVNRSTGVDFTSSIAIPQVVPSPAATDAP
jgi:hypothetical protein